MQAYFYEVIDPYHAIIKAHNEDEVLKIYEEIVCDIDKDEQENFFDDLRIISDDHVRTQLTNCYVEIDSTRLMTPQEQEEAFNSKAPSLILMEAP